MKSARNPPRGNRFARAYAASKGVRRADVGEASLDAFAELSGSQDAPRTFARLTAFDVACPNCGTIDSISSARPWWKRKANFDSWRSRWRCRVCRRVFAVGLALWPVSRAGNRPREARPVDTIPTPQELLGLQLAAERGWSDPVNLSCECPDGEASPACPLHARTHSETVSGSPGR